jgi:hypothetical protein
MPEGMSSNVFPMLQISFSDGWLGVAVLRELCAGASWNVAAKRLGAQRKALASESGRYKGLAERGWSPEKRG